MRTRSQYKGWKLCKIHGLICTRLFRGNQIHTYFSKRRDRAIYMIHFVSDRRAVVALAKNGLIRSLVLHRHAYDFNIICLKECFGLWLRCNPLASRSHWKAPETVHTLCAHCTVVGPKNHGKKLKEPWHLECSAIRGLCLKQPLCLSSAAMVEWAEWTFRRPLVRALLDRPTALKETFKAQPMSMPRIRFIFLSTQCMFLSSNYSVKTLCYTWKNCISLKSF